MLDRLRPLFAAPVFEGDDDRTREAALLNAITWAVGISLAFFSLSAFIAPDPAITLAIAGVMLALVVAVRWLLHRGLVRQGSGVLVLAMWLFLTAVATFFGGLEGSAVWGLVAVVAVAGLVLGGTMSFPFALLCIATGLGLLLAGELGVLPRPLGPETGVTRWAALSVFILIVMGLVMAATRSLRLALRQARGYAQDLEVQQAALQAAVAERNKDLERRARYLAATAAIAHDTAAALDLNELLSRVAVLINDTFGYYHTGVFMLDRTREWAVLVAASSEGGRRMLARGHRLSLGTGIVGYVAARGEQRIAMDTGADRVFFNNPDLPATRSEAAMPLSVRGEVTGVLDVQSEAPDAFGTEDVAVLQALADQITVAISNAQLLARAQDSLEAERRAYRTLTREAWAGTRERAPGLGYRYQEGTVLRLAGDTAPGDGPETLPEVALPVRVRGATVAAIDAHKPAGRGEWTAEELALLGTLADQLGLALESARLYEDTQRRAEREQLIGQLTARLRESLDVDTVLKTAVQEMRQALGLSTLTLWLSAGAESTPPVTEARV